MRVLVVGGGGREHALIWKLAGSGGVEKIFCAPGNAGIALMAECVPIGTGEISSLLNFARGKKIDLTIVGPEAPLVEGIVDLFREAKMLILGPDKNGARLEGSKAWAKAFMQKYHLPSASFKVFDDPQTAGNYLEQAKYPIVVKADGLAAGKGVVIAENYPVALEAVQGMMVKKAFGQAGTRVVVEEYLQGEEVSLFALTDGQTYFMLPSAQDHKAIYEGDRGPNTGGMGAYSPAGILTPELREAASKQIFAPVLAGLQQEGIDYRGVIYAGCMLTPEGLKVLEFNVRFGDPEAQVILPRLTSPLLPLLFHAANGTLNNLEPPQWSAQAAVCVVMASGGYPGEYELGKVIYGLEEARSAKAMVFHAGTARRDNLFVTSGGRVLGVTAWDDNLQEAIRQAYRLVERINFAGAYYRRDIGYRALSR